LEADENDAGGHDQEEEDIVTKSTFLLRCILWLHVIGILLERNLLLLLLLLLLLHHELELLEHLELLSRFIDFFSLRIALHWLVKRVYNIEYFNNMF
jgi:hypothetical protein